MEPLMLNGFEVHGVQGDDASCGIIEALHQIDDGRLPTSTGTHQGNLAPWWYVQAYILQHLDENQPRVHCGGIPAGSSQVAPKHERATSYAS